MPTLKELQDEVNDAKKDLKAAEKRLEAAERAVTEALNDKSLSVFDRWDAWTKKNNHSKADPRYLAPYVKPKKPWRALTEAIMAANNLSAWTGAEWSWKDEFKNYIVNGQFQNAPLDDATMAAAMEEIMKYDVTKFALMPLNEGSY